MSQVLPFASRSPYPRWLPAAMAVNLVLGAAFAWLVTDNPSPAATPAAASAPAPVATGEAVQVEGVVDGDTLKVYSAELGHIRVRLTQIDAPEHDQPYGAQSRQRLSSLIAGHAVRLHTEGTDRYGRTLATVYADGVDVNRRMVETGAAWAYRDYLTDYSLIGLEHAARNERAGLWASDRAVEPSDWRRRG